MKLSDYVAKTIKNLGVSHVFTVVGGANLHLVHSINNIQNLNRLYISAI